MNEQIPNQENYPIPPYREPVTQPSPRRRATLWLLALPLLACVACAALSIYALMPLRGKIMERFNGQMIPVTGEETAVPDNQSPVQPLPDQKVKPEASATPEPGANSGAEPSRAVYRDALDRHLNSCTVSFHEFLILEQSAFDQPDLLDSGGWRSQAKDAASAFHDDCLALGSLPDAPSAYTQVDQLLKKAAAEVQPATDDFNALLDASSKGSQNSDKARSAMRHMVNFIRLTQRAEDVLSGLDEMKQI